MTRHVLNLQQLDGASIQQWMDSPTSTHVSIDGVTLSVEQVEEFVRIGKAEGGAAQERYLDRLRPAA